MISRDRFLPPGPDAAARVEKIRALEQSGDAAAADGELCAAIAAYPKSPGLYTLRAAARARLGRWDEAVEDAHAAIGLHPENLDGFIRVFYEKVGLGRPDPATEKAVLVQALERTLAAEPECAWAYALKAEAEKRAGFFRHEASVADLEKATTLDPKRAWMRAFLGRARTAFHRTGPHAEAGLREMDEAVRLDPERGWLRAWRAEVLKDMGREEEALAELDKALAFDPDYKLSNSWRGSLRLKRGDFAGAAADFTAALDARPGNSWTLHQRGEANRRLGRWAPMASDYYGSVDAYYKYALLHMGLKDATPKSVLTRVALYLSADAAAPAAAPDAAAPARLKRAGAGGLFSFDDLRDILRTGAGIFQGSIARLTGTVERLAGTVEGILADVGAQALDSGNAGAAKGSFELLMQFDPLTIEELETAAKAAPGAPLVLLWRGRVRLNGGEPDAALADFRAAQAPAPLGLAALWEGEALTALGRLDEAEAAYTRSLDAAPKNALAYAWRAGVRARLGRVPEAWDDLLTAARKDPSQSKLYYSWAKLLIELMSVEPGSALAELALRAQRPADAAALAAKTPEAVTSRVVRALALAETGDAGAAEKELAAVAAAEPAEAVEDLARLCTEVIHLQEPALALALRTRAEAKLRLRDFAGGRADAEQAYALRPEDPWLRGQAAAWDGQALLDAGRFADAVAAYGRALDSDGGNVLAWVGRAMARKELGELQASVADFEKARTLAPELFAEAAS